MIAAGRRSPEAQAEFDAEADAEATEEVENLLESYFIQIDRAFNRLRSLGKTFLYILYGLHCTIDWRLMSEPYSIGLPAPSKLPALPRYRAVLELTCSLRLCIYDTRALPATSSWET